MKMLYQRKKQNKKIKNMILAVTPTAWGSLIRAVTQNFLTNCSEIKVEELKKSLFTGSVELPDEPLLD